MGFSKCLVCYEDVQGGMVRVQDHKRNNRTDSKLLKSQVSIVFLVHNLLEVPLDECAKYLQKYGNPSQWITLCEKCNSILKEALDINYNIIKLSNDLKNIKERLINQIKIKVEQEDGEELVNDDYDDDDQDPNWLIGRNATLEIRQRIDFSNAWEFPVNEEFNGIWSECPLSNEESNEESVPIVINPLSPILTSSDQESDTEWSPNLENIARKTLKTTKRSERLRKRKRDGLHEEKSHDSKILPPPRKYKKRNSERERLKSTSDSSETSSNLKPKKSKKKEIATKEKEILVKHSRYFCDICNLYFNGPKFLNQHSYEVHNFGIKCALCDYVVTNSVNYEDHHRSAHNPKSISLCSGCDKWMSSSWDFNKHLKKNPKCIEKAIQCDICKRMYSTQESLELHKEMQHVNPPPPPFHCLECNLHFTRKQGLKFHMGSHHTSSGKTKSFTCDKCGNSFALEHRLKFHIQSVHINKEPDGRKYPCGDCDLVFTSKPNFNRHRKLHGEESPFLCTICGKRYKVGNQLTVHMWSHDPDRHLKYSTYKKGKNKPKSKDEKKKLDKKETNMELEGRDKEPEVGEQLEE